jgi:hypothetical protein
MRAIILSLLCLAAGPALAQEKFVSSNMDVRTILNFKVSDAAIGKLVPAGWEIDAPKSGPATGANLRVTFIDQMANWDASGKGVPPARNLVFGILAKKKGAETGGLMIFSGLSPNAGGPYGASLKATHAVERKFRHEASGTTVDESWDYKAENGSATSLQIQYVRGVAARNKGELLVFAQPKPEFYRIYRYEQGVDVLRGAGVGAERLKNVTFKATGGQFSALFDGTEQLININSVPWYQREIYLPGS